MMWPRITIVTPNFNMDEYLERTIVSVLGQNYPNLEYIIIDGGSSDSSVEIIKRYSKEISHWLSEPDTGLYDALNKGFKSSTGEIMGWLNSDDILHKGSLHTLARLFAANPDMNWLQGWPNTIDLNDQVIHKRPHVSNRANFFLKDFLTDVNAYVQQESTFWRRNLWDRAGGYMDETFKLAGDFELWMRFFRYDTLYNTRELLGAYRKRIGQKSGDIDSYNREAERIVERELKLLNVTQNLGLKMLAGVKARRKSITPLYNKFFHKYFEGPFVD